MAGTTGLEPATSDVTGRRSNQLNYVPVLRRTCRMVAQGLTNTRKYIADDEKLHKGAQMSSLARALAAFEEFVRLPDPVCVPPDRPATYCIANATRSLTQAH